MLEKKKTETLTTMFMSKYYVAVLLINCIGWWNSSQYNHSKQRRDDREQTEHSLRLSGFKLRTLSHGTRLAWMISQLRKEQSTFLVIVLSCRHKQQDRQSNRESGNSMHIVKEKLRLCVPWRRMGLGVKTLFILTFDSKWRRVVSFLPRPFCLWRKCFQ